MISIISINKIQKVNYKVRKLIVCQNLSELESSILILFHLFSCGSLKVMWLMTD